MHRLINKYCNFGVREMTYFQGVGLVFLLYIVFGKLGLFLAIQPGNASAIWPPAGIALAFMIISDCKWWPGVFLGSFVLNTYGVFTWNSYYGEIFTNTITAMGMATGATLQPVIGAMVSKTILNDDLTMTSPRKTLKFFLYAGVFCCLISATTAIFSLSVIRGILIENLFFAWFNWYVGDTIGVLIFAPLTLGLLLDKTVNRRVKFIQVGIPCLFILMITSMSFYYAQKWEQNRLQMQFEKVVSELTLLMEKEVEENNEIIISIERLFSSDEEVTRSEFKSFTSHFLENHSKIRGLSWVPLISSQNRAEYELKIRDEGYPDFEIYEVDAQNNKIRAGEKSYYAPIGYSAPERKLKFGVGFDLTTREDRRQAMDLSGILGKPYASDPVYLLNDPEKKDFAFLLFYPVYGRQGSGVAEKKLVRGYVAGVFEVNTFVDAVFKDWKPEWMKISINDVSNEGQEKFIYGIPKGEIYGKAKKGISPVSRVVNMSGKSWEITYAPDDGFNVFSRTWQTWSVLVVGLFLTGIVGLFMNMQFASSEMIGTLNSELGRKLDLVEQTQRVILENLNEGILLVDEHGKILLLSDSVKGMIMSAEKNRELVNINEVLPNWTKLRIKNGSEHLTEMIFSSGAMINIECKISKVEIGAMPNYLIVLKPTMKKVAEAAHLPHFH